MSKIIGVVDLETTGFLKSGGKIVEVAIVGLDLETGNIKELFNSVCRETGLTAKDRNAWIFQNSDLLVEDVRSAPRFQELMPEIQTIIDGLYGITAYNKSFDFGFFEDRGLVINNELDCPMLLATDIVKAPHKQSWKNGYKWPSVTECYEYFFGDDVNDYVEAHRSLSDCFDEAKIVYELYRLGHYR